jgi:hypothetical protein
VSELERLALARNIAARLHLASHEEIRLLDRLLVRLEQTRACADLRGWLRRLSTTPYDRDDLYHLVARRTDVAVTTLCSGSWLAGDATEAMRGPPLTERCLVCWRAGSAGDPLRLALIAAMEELADEDQERAELREAARAEMLGSAAPACSTCNDTHRMELREREAPCTRCPVPCQACRDGAYCATTPCACACHARARAEMVGEVRR